MGEPEDRPVSLRVTREELMAAAALAGLQPPPEVVGLRPDQRAELEGALGVGRRVLLARGLLQPPGAEGGLDPRLVTVVRLMCAAPAAFFVGRTGPAGDATALLYAADGEAVFMAQLEPYLFSVHHGTWADLDDVLANLAGLADIGEPATDIDVTLDLAGVELAVDAAAPPSIPAGLRAGLEGLHDVVGEAVEQDAVHYTILVLPRGDAAPVDGAPALSWTAQRTGGLLAFDLRARTQVAVRSASAATVRATIAAMVA